MDDACFIDMAQGALEEAAIAAFLKNRQREHFLGIWFDIDGHLAYDTGHGRGEVIMDLEGEVYATYQLKNGEWQFVAGSQGVNHDRLLEKFLEEASAAKACVHPTRHLRAI